MPAFTFSDKSILVVEDQRPFLTLMRGLLSNLGAASVAIAGNAEHAITLCRKSNFDMVVADLHLGSDRKNGYELVEELRTRKWIKPSAVFLLISADSARPIVLGSIEKRPDDYLVKPFSQAQIKSRLIRGWLKRQFLAPIFFAVEKGQFKQAIEIAQSLFNEDSPYHRICQQTLIELYWQTDQPKLALELIEQDHQGQHSIWMQVAKGKTLLALKDFDGTVAVANQLIKRNKFCVDAYDILAESLCAQDLVEEALTTIQKALKISPFSLSRQYIACKIARQQGDYPLASDTCLSIWKQSRRSVHQSASHWCTYVRSLLDAAQHATEKKQKYRFQQEVMLVMQRSRNDESLHRMTDEFDFTIFQELVDARVNAIDGKLIEAKRSLTKSQFAIEKRFEKFPAVYAPDSVQSLFQIGEFEQGMALVERLKAENTALDPNSQYAVEQAEQSADEQQKNYLTLNKQGISLYQQGKFVEAKEVFHAAQKIAPVNTGVALNLLQCLLKMINQSTKEKPDARLVSECRSVYKLIDGMPLVAQHSEKFELLREELLPLLEQE